MIVREGFCALGCFGTVARAPVGTGVGKRLEARATAPPPKQPPTQKKKNPPKKEKQKTVAVYPSKNQGRAASGVGKGGHEVFSSERNQRSAAKCSESEVVGERGGQKSDKRNVGDEGKAKSKGRPSAAGEGPMLLRTNIYAGHPTDGQGKTKRAHIATEETSLGNTPRYPLMWDVESWRDAKKGAL